MKPRVIGYWICTVLIGFSFFSSGVAHLMRVPQVVEGITQLGYPLHFITILGIWKVLGGSVILLPGLPLVKEWAYAGMIFDLTGASVAQATAGDDIRNIVSPLVLSLLVVASWALRPASRTLKPLWLRSDDSHGGGQGQSR